MRRILLAALVALAACASSAQPLPEELKQAAQRQARLGGSVMPANVLAGYITVPRVTVLRIEALPTSARLTAISAEAARLLRSAETAFVADPNASSIDLLPDPARTRYLSFKWDENDYPGGPVGPNESEVLALDAALSRVRPERRANSTATAVMREPEFDDAAWKYIESELRPVPGQTKFKLNRWARASFLTMREAAKRDGVDIVILSSSRLPATAARNAASAGNSYAVARFSSHILGLAMDIQLRDVALDVPETSTRPMSNVIAMRRSKAHKWIFLRGAAHGWYPYQHEPWHWEYNPPGFRERFFANRGK